MKKITPFVVPPLLVILLFFIASTISTIPAGYVGIPVLFGRVQSGYLEPGIHFKNPFTRVVKFDLRTQKLMKRELYQVKKCLI